MSVNSLLNDDSSKGWSNLYVNSLTTYKGIRVKGNINVEGLIFDNNGIPVSGDPFINYSGSGIFARDVNSGQITVRNLGTDDVVPILQNRVFLTSEDDGTGNGTNILKIRSIFTDDIIPPNDGVLSARNGQVQCVNLSLTDITQASLDRGIVVV